MKFILSVNFRKVGEVVFTEHGFSYDTDFYPLQLLLQNSKTLNAGSPENIKFEKVTLKNSFLLFNELTKQGYQIKIIK